MALEIEIKMPVRDHAPTRASLKSAGATFVKRQLETNTFLDTRGSDLLRGGSGLRVRRAGDLDSGHVDVIITHKGPKRPGAMKIREETELHVESYDDAIRLLGQLGYEVKLSFEKRRETWEIGGCEVVLDEVPELGLFVEVEGRDEQHVGDVRARIGLASAPVEPEGYALLVAAHLKASGRTTLTFVD